jgi:hypothetical protein
MLALKSPTSMHGSCSALIRDELELIPGEVEPCSLDVRSQNEKVVKRETWAGIEALGLELKSVVNYVINLNLW